MQKKYIELPDIKVNTAESAFGDILFMGDICIIPFYNVWIDEVSTDIVGIRAGGCLKYCYMLLTGVTGVTSDYEVSRLMDRTKRICIGGSYYKDGRSFEYWFLYDNYSIFLSEGFEYTESIGFDLSFCNIDFFKIFPEEILKHIDIK